MEGSNSASISRAMTESRQDETRVSATRSITRRRFLAVTLGGGLSVFSTAAFPLPGRVRDLFSPPEPGLDSASATGLLGDEEMTEVFALAETLLPHHLDIGVTRRFARHHVNERTSNHEGYLEEYERAVALLQRATRDLFDSAAGFSALPVIDRHAVLRELLETRRTGVRRLGNLFDRIFGATERPAFRIYVVQDLLQAFYRSADGWALVGYTNYPGVPARNPREYTRPLTR
jgi:hypothetical protein